MKTQFTFASQDERVTATAFASGIESLVQAEYAGHHLASALSISTGQPMHLSFVSLSNEEFIAIPAPSYWMDGVTVEAPEIPEIVVMQFSEVAEEMHAGAAENYGRDY